MRAWMVFLFGYFLSLSACQSLETPIPTPRPTSLPTAQLVASATPLTVLDISDPDHLPMLVEIVDSEKGSIGFPNAEVFSITNGLTGDQYRAALYLRTKDGRFIWARTSMEPLPLADDASGIASGYEYELLEGDEIVWEERFGAYPTLVKNKVILENGQEVYVAYRDPMSGEWRLLDGLGTDNSMLHSEKYFVVDAATGELKEVLDLSGDELSQQFPEVTVVEAPMEGVQIARDAEGNILGIQVRRIGEVPGGLDMAEYLAERGNEWFEVESVVGKKYSRAKME